MKRHVRESYYIVGEGVYSQDTGYQSPPSCYPPPSKTEPRMFRFSRLGAKGDGVDQAILAIVAQAMTANPGTDPDSGAPTVPAGYTYLGQFIDHDMTMDNTSAALGDAVTVDDMIQGRSPALDLDSVYGRGPQDPDDAKFYAPDGLRLKVGRTAAAPSPGVPATSTDLDGFDLPRSGPKPTKAESRKALIPDHRNDENLAVAQTHLAFLRLHNQVVTNLVAQSVPSAALFEQAKDLVVKHYQWMLKTDYLPRIVDPAIVTDVFTNGRQFFESGAAPDDMPTMPIEFSVAAFRLGHSQVRGAYEWNAVFNTNGPFGVASLLLLFTFSGTSGTLSPGTDLNDPEAGSFERLPTNWIADFRRLYDFPADGFATLGVTADQQNHAKRIDTFLVNPLDQLPLGSFGARGTNPPPPQANLAFRNLVRAEMVELASGQQMAALMGVKELSATEILDGAGTGVTLSDKLTPAQQDAFTADTPLWFYILREAELHDGRLAGVGGRIVAEVFHRAIEGSKTSIVRDTTFKPSLGPDDQTFRMVDLLLAGCADPTNPTELNPLG